MARRRKPLALDTEKARQFAEFLEVAAWLDDRHQRGVDVRWRFNTANARLKLHRLYPSLP
jgi:hypothetical protein